MLAAGNCLMAFGDGVLIATQKMDEMNGIKLVAVVLLVAGVLALLYGGFSYTKDTTAVKLGPIELSVKERETVNVPVWAGVGAIIVGGLLLVFGGRKG
jgi:hypothetical protein